MSDKLTSEQSKLFMAIFEAMRHHQMSNMQCDDGEGFYPLVDLMTRDGMDIGDGIEQMQNLSWAIEEAVETHIAAQDAENARLKTAAAGCLGRMQSAWPHHQETIALEQALATHPTSQTVKDHGND